jgi:hypothetical protein
MIKIVKTSDKLLPRKINQSWPTSRSAVVCNNSNVSVVSDDVIDEISNSIDNNNENSINVTNNQCNKLNKLTTDVKNAEINNYINDFIKQNGSIINKKEVAMESKKVILG